MHCQFEMSLFYFHCSAPGSIVADSMYRIKQVSSKMLEEKVADAAISASDTVAKRDIMSLLVRARIADKGDGYQMSDRAMMDQVVCVINVIRGINLIYIFKLTFLGAGHETTASGLAWVCCSHRILYPLSFFI